MKTTVSLLLALALPLTAAAQAPADTAATYKHQLGLTASPLLNGFFKNNRSLPLGLLYKRQVNPNQAWRVRAELLYRYFKQEAPLDLGEEYNQTDHRLEVAVGKEYLFRFGSRFIGYAGLEVGATYSPSERDFKVYQQIQIQDPNTGQLQPAKGFTEGQRKFNAVGVFIQPIAGIRYRFRSRLYAEAEASLTVRWTRTHFTLDEQVFVYDTGLPANYSKGAGDNVYYNLTASLRPVSAIHIVFLF